MLLNTLRRVGYASRNRLPNIKLVILKSCFFANLLFISLNWNVKGFVSSEGCVRHAAAYEGEGKTTVRVINQEYELGLMIDTYATVGYRTRRCIAPALRDNLWLCHTH